jgi:hypothetical protein
MVQLYQYRKKFREAGILILAVSFETIESAGMYLQDTKLEWPIILDEQKNLYHYFGMGEAGFWDIWGYRTWLAYFRELTRGGSFRKGEGNIHQRGGDVLIDPKGSIRLHHVGKGPGDRPEIRSILQFVKK